MHTVETEHFIIFSAWSPAHDAALANTCERMFASLRNQFSLPNTATVWTGKLPVYIFWNKIEFDAFTSQIDKSELRSTEERRVNGYHATKGLFSYIVLNGVVEPTITSEQAIQRFYSVLVHEGTHAFLSGLISARPIARWVNEGLADYMAALLVPQGEAGQKHLTSARRAVAGRPADLHEIFTKSQLTPFEYGVAQGLVRYLIQLHPQAFVQFITRMKEGESDEVALTKSYKLSRQQLLNGWLLFSQSRLASGSN